MNLPQDHFRQPVSAPGRGAGGENWLSLPEYFKSNGYITMGSGKLYHPQASVCRSPGPHHQKHPSRMHVFAPHLSALPERPPARRPVCCLPFCTPYQMLTPGPHQVPPDNDYNQSWSHPYPYYSPECYPPKCPSSSARAVYNGSDPFGKYTFTCISEDPPRGGGGAAGYTLCPTNTSKDETRWEHMLEDQRIQVSCSQQLRASVAAVKAGSFANFFVGCGFHKPHVPWVFPGEFLDLFPTNLSDIPLASRMLAPEGMPDVAWHAPADVHGMDNGPYSLPNLTRARNFRRGYYAAVAYTDYNIGKVLATLSELGVEDSTAVVVFGDHGWQLGEHATWAKMTNFVGMGCGTRLSCILYLSPPLPPPTPRPPRQSALLQ